MVVLPLAVNMAKPGHKPPGLTYLQCQAARLTAQGNRHYDFQPRIKLLCNHCCLSPQPRKPLLIISSVMKVAKLGRKPPQLTYLQRQAARLTAQANRRAINGDVDEVLNFVDAEAKRLSLKYKRSAAWFHHQFYQGGRVVRQKRAVSVFNAARQIDGFLAGRKGGKSRTQLLVGTSKYCYRA